MNPNQTYMTRTMDALVRVVDNASNTSLASLGYTHAGLDDFWQACGTGVNGSFHDYAGNPLINLTRFPNMTAMTAHGHQRGLQVGWCVTFRAGKQCRPHTHVLLARET
jgi:hypothetical protein